MRVLIAGANGRTGRPIIAALSEKGATVRAFIRSEEQSRALQDIGASEFAVGDMGDPDSIGAAIADCDKLVHIGPPMHPSEVEFTDNFIEAARRSGLSHFIYYSVMHPLRRDVRHHRLKLDAEEHLIESGLPYTIVQPCRYMQHLEPIWQKVLSEGTHSMPFDVDKKFSVVDLEDLAEAVAIVATRSGHTFATYELAGPEPLSQRDMAQLISSVTGREVEARATPIEKMKAAAAAKGFSEDKIEQMSIMNEHYDRHGFPGNPHVLRSIIGRDPATFENYVQRLAATV